MPTVADVSDFLGVFAPPHLAEKWDNFGLLVGRRDRHVTTLMTCLTITPESAAEAIEAGVELIVAHHPLPFHPVERITDATTVGRLLLDLIAANVAVYSPHTAFDSAVEGINQRLAEGLGLCDVAPLMPHTEGQGTGRRGRLADPVSLSKLAERLKHFLSIKRLQLVGQPDRPIRTVAVGCGAADELLAAAHANACDAMVLGEARFHTCLEAEALGIALLLPGHFASERFGVEALAGVLAGKFPEVEIWPSQRERDPLRWE